MPPKKTELSRPIWKQGDGWIRYDPPRNHPGYEEWLKVLEKHFAARTVPE